MDQHGKRRRRRLLQHDYGMREGADREKYNAGLERVFGKKPLPYQRRGRYVVHSTTTPAGDRKVRWSDGTIEIIACPEEKRSRRQHKPFPEIIDTA